MHPSEGCPRRGRLVGPGRVPIRVPASGNGLHRRFARSLRTRVTSSLSVPPVTCSAIATADTELLPSIAPPARSPRAASGRAAHRAWDVGVAREGLRSSLRPLQGIRAGGCDPHPRNFELVRSGQRVDIARAAGERTRDQANTFIFCPTKIVGNSGNRHAFLITRTGSSGIRSTEFDQAARSDRVDRM